MNRALLTLLTLFTLAAPLSAWNTGISYTLSPSPLFNWTWSPALDGMALGWDFSTGGKVASLRGGLEAGVQGLGLQLLLPLSVEAQLWQHGSQGVAAGAGGIIGIAMFKPAPLLILGAQAGASWSIYWSAQWGLEASLNIRYLTSPAYSRLVAPYQVVDLPVSVGLRYRGAR
ncbi:MAG TPA: hypothetical protein VMW69_07480 [Spirochaetia bacterium]|nr:hypothetical protein [Spirochaetia bacterium]